ncbi:metal-dependent transcriptional regulator [uncultured Helcococcus sp.]|uniref:metal-dependent transcriptional regulator n=1 Tax=uncultured Helcococcus sp. TaxID=1072508 RepID=UPI0028891247|nr:metal-dependent transcriptional regulator [uncultured Helcococcus sp.]
MKVIPERNEYLTTIFKLKESNKKVTNKALSQALDISPSSVTEMVKKLKNDGLLKDQKTIDLSQDGEDYAKDIVSKHRLWEYFLTENLKYNWEDVHEQAQLLQNVTSDKMFEDLNRFLGEPETCPHGGIIYSNLKKSNNKISLDEAKVGLEYTIQSIFDDKSLLTYINKIGLKIGEKLKVIEFNEIDDSVDILINDKDNINLSHKVSKDIFLI